MPKFEARICLCFNWIGVLLAKLGDNSVNESSLG